MLFLKLALLFIGLHFLCVFVFCIYSKITNKNQKVVDILNLVDNDCRAGRARGVQRFLWRGVVLSKWASFVSLVLYLFVLILFSLRA